MGIKISRQTQRAQDIQEGKIDSVSIKELKLRRDTCSTCDLVSKSTDPKYAIFNGLYFQSQCKAVKELLSECLIDPEFVCPMKKF